MISWKARCAAHMNGDEGDVANTSNCAGDARWAGGTGGWMCGVERRKGEEGRGVGGWAEALRLTRH